MVCSKADSRVSLIYRTKQKTENNIKTTNDKKQFTSEEMMPYCGPWLIILIGNPMLEVGTHWSV